MVVWLVVVGGRSAVETLTSRPILPGLAPSGSTPAAGCSRRSNREKPQARTLRQGFPTPYRLFIGWEAERVHYLPR